MNENGRKKREWIKTAAIVFLAVMLVLTFFSNTIQNWSLPEVATQYVQSGTITAKIRGTGTVESTDPYDVKVTETKKVDSVAVRVGDTVKEGDVLVYLAAGDGDELKKAKEELETAQAKYKEALLNEKITVSDISAAGNGMTMESYRTQLTVAQNAVKAAENALEPMKDEVDRIQQLIDDFTQQVAYEQSMISIAPDRIAAAETEMKNAAAATQKYLERRNGAEVQWKQAEDAYLAQTVSGGDAAVISQLDEKRKTAKENYDNAVREHKEAGDRENDARDKYNDAVKDPEDRKSVVLDMNDAIAGFKLDLYNAKKDLAAAEDDVKEKQKNLAELLTKIGNVTSLQSYLDAIEKAQKNVDELSEKAGGSTITAPISGTISTINVRAGENASAATPVIVMQREGRGYTLSFSVTNEQARRLSVGDKADLVNAWRYDDLNVTLANIRPDTSNPGENKLLTFNVEGNVVAGQSLSLSVGQKSANYDYIVPNSAIREDSNGKFILKVESKSSPLGTRYTARRVDVTVLASDDKQSAVSGALEGHEFVITTSTKPVESGKLIRLTD